MNVVEDAVGDDSILQMMMMTTALSSVEMESKNNI